jgi:cob(I)alamin adenosyltransferase
MQKYQAYPFLAEQELLCDYEIMTDELASMIGWCLSASIDVADQFLVSVVYHANGSIRAKLAVSPQDVECLELLYLSLDEQLGHWKQMVLPLGCELAMRWHLVRVKCKAVLRLMYQIACDHTVDQVLFDWFHLLANYAFLRAILANQEYQHSELTFRSRSYVS